jgi:iron complex outermembrane receptor protein
VSAEGGSLATGRLRGSAARSFSDDSEVIFSATGYHSDGESQIFYPALASTTPTHGLATGLDHDEFWQVFGSASRRGWKAQGLWSARTKGIPTGAFGTSINDDRSRTRDARGYVDLSYDAAWRGTTVSWRGAYDQYDYDGTYAAQVEEGLDPDPQADYGRGAWWSTEATVRRRAASSHLVTAGVEVRDNIRQDQGTYYTSSGGVLLDDRRSSTVFGLYAQDEYRVSRRVLLNVGVRYDNLQGEIGATSPRAALILRPLDRASLKVLYGQAFRAPNVYELFYAGPGESRTLTPERIRSSEIIWEQYVGGRLKISASGFFDRIRDLITQIDTDTVIGVDFANLESAQTAGVALEGEMALPRGMHASATYTYADARRPLTGERLSNSPANLGHAAFASPVGRTRLFIGVDGMFIGARQALSGATVDGAAVWNVTLTDRHGPGGTSIGFDVRNLFNTAYGDPGSAEHVQDVLPQLGRTAGVRVAWRF